MKKILVAFAGTCFPEGVLRFVSRLNDVQPLLLTAAFLPENVFANMYSYETGLPGESFVPVVVEEDKAVIEKSISRIGEWCQRKGIQYRIHEDYNSVLLPELKSESRFADLLIINGEKFYEGWSTGEPNPTLKEVLHNAECPVLVVPENFDFPERNILAYDGSEASVYAIKQFAYLFPELCGNETVLVYADEDDGAQMPDEQAIEELATQHFKNLEVTRLQLNAKKFFGTWLSNSKKAILVSGAYGRSGLSQLFKKSFASDVLANHNLPVFIAHR